jgi:hypothetical protein
VVRREAADQVVWSGCAESGFLDPLHQVVAVHRFVELIRIATNVCLDMLVNRTSARRSQGVAPSQVHHHLDRLSVVHAR